MISTMSLCERVAGWALLLLALLVCPCDAAASSMRLPSGAFAHPLVWSDDYDGGSGGYLHHYSGSSWIAPPSRPLNAIFSADSTSSSSPHSFHTLQVNDAQWAPLIDLFNATGGPSWSNSLGWTATSTPVCAQPPFGVTCSNATGRVVSIQLVNNGLAGLLPASLSFLTSLTYVDFSLNPGVAGSIPSTWSSLNMTYFNVRGDGMTGALPTLVCQWQWLQYLDLSDNFLVGALPPCLGGLSQLQQLSVGENSLSGSIPTSFAGLRLLYLLDMSHNALSGSFAPVTGLPTLSAIFLHHNNFAGALPLSLLSSRRLIMVDLSHNNLTSIDCSPYEAGTSTNQSGLVDVILSYNALSDTIADVITCLATLAPNSSWIDLSHNELTWDGSADLRFSSSFFPFIYKLDVSYNALGGDVGYFLESFFWLGQLYYFDLENTALTGTATDIASQFLSLNAAGNPLMTAGFNASTSPPAVLMPNWLTLVRSTQLEQVGRHMSCPLIAPSASSNLISLSVDPSYLAYQHCACDPSYAVSPSSNFSQPATVSCTLCPVNVDCDTAVFSPHHAPTPGYYPWPMKPAQYNNDSQLLVSATMVACNPLSVCTLAQNSDGSQSFACASGHDMDSFLCSRCLAGSFSWNGNCNSCGGVTQGSWILPMFIVIAGLLCYAGAVWYFEREERAKYNRSHARHEAQAKADEQRAQQERRQQNTDATALPVYLAAPPPGGGMHREPSRHSHVSTNDAAYAEDEREYEDCQSPVKPARTPSPDPTVRSHSPAPPPPKNGPLTLVGMSRMVVDSRHWAFVDILIFWWQTSTVLQGLNYQDSTASTDASSSMANLSVVGYLLRFSPFAFECMIHGITFDAYFWVILFSPLWLSGATYLTYRGLDALHRVMMYHGWADVFMPTWIFARACIRLLALLLSLVYMQVAIFAFEVWVCDEVSGQGHNSYRYLHAAPYVQCLDGPHVAMIVFSVLMFGFFVLGLPIATVHWMRSFELRSVEEDVEAARPYRTIRQLFTEDAKDKLRPEMGQWQGCVVLRKLVLTAIVYLIPAGSSAIPVLVLLILFLLVAAQAWYTPYYRWVDNVLESGLLVHLALEFLVSILIGEAALRGDTGSYNSLRSFLSALNWIGYAVVFIVVVLHVCLYFIKDDAERLQRWGERISERCCACVPSLSVSWRSRFWNFINAANYVQAGSEAYALGGTVAAMPPKSAALAPSAITLLRGSSAPAYPVAHAPALPGVDMRSGKGHAEDEKSHAARAYGGGGVELISPVSSTLSPPPIPPHPDHHVGSMHAHQLPSTPVVRVDIAAEDGRRAPLS